MMPNETTNTPILTLDSDAKLETAQSISDLTWHEIQNAYRTRRILTGMLGGIEKTENGSLIAVVYYKDFRTVIPVTEMMIHLMQDEALPLIVFIFSCRMKHTIMGSLLCGRTKSSTICLDVRLIF